MMESVTFAQVITVLFWAQLLDVCFLGACALVSPEKRSQDTNANRFLVALFVFAVICVVLVLFT